MMKISFEYILIKWRKLSKYLCVRQSILMGNPYVLILSKKLILSKNKLRNIIVLDLLFKKIYRNI